MGGARSETSASSAVAAHLAQLTRLLGRFKASVHNATDGSSVGNQLLAQILTHGPMRSGELAQYSQADPSTISRQVADLVRDGMLERRADPNDGRAVLLHATEAGRERHQAHLRSRDQHYLQMLADWPVEDQRTFAVLLARFTESFDDYQATLLADITERSSGRRHRFVPAAVPTFEPTDSQRREGTT